MDGRTDEHPDPTQFLLTEARVGIKIIFIFSFSHLNIKDGPYMTRVRYLSRLQKHDSRCIYFREFRAGAKFAKINTPRNCAARLAHSGRAAVSRVDPRSNGKQRVNMLTLSTLE